MIYASSKDALRKQLVGISAEIQATSYDEITYEAGKQSFIHSLRGSLEPTR
jgi:cofilin